MLTIVSHQNCKLAFKKYRQRQQYCENSVHISQKIEFLIVAKSLIIRMLLALLAFLHTITKTLRPLAQSQLVE